MPSRRRRQAVPRGASFAGCSGVHVLPPVIPAAASGEPGSITRAEARMHGSGSAPLRELGRDDRGEEETVLIASPPFPAARRRGRSRASRACARSCGTPVCRPPARLRGGARDAALAHSVRLHRVLLGMAAVEARELAHEIVEALVRAGEVAQHRDHERRGAAGPQEQGEMGEIAARDHGVGDGVEVHVSPSPLRGGSTRAKRERGGGRGRRARLGSIARFIDG